MFFGKCEKKKHSATLILTVGALAAIGAMSITKCGKQMMQCMKQKITDIFNKEKAMCDKQNQ